LEISSVGTVHVRAGEQNTSVSASTPLVHGSIVGGAPAAQRPWRERSAASAQPTTSAESAQKSRSTTRETPFTATGVRAASCWAA